MKNGQKRKKIFLKDVKKIAFVCSGGGTKAGAFHLGVALALRTKGFRFLGGMKKDPLVFAAPPSRTISLYVGSSAGAMVSSYLAAGFHLENIFSAFLNKPLSQSRKLYPKSLPPLTYGKMLTLRKKEIFKELLRHVPGAGSFLRDMFGGRWSRLLQFNWLKTTGLFSTEGLEQYLRKEVLSSNSFEDYRADLFIPATPLDGTRKVVFGKKVFAQKERGISSFCDYERGVTISKAAAASTALPFLYAPYAIERPPLGKTYYFDGEIRDTLSTHVAVDHGADIVFASYTHQPYQWTLERGSLMKQGLGAIAVQAIYLLIEQKIRYHRRSLDAYQQMLSFLEPFLKQEGMSSEKRDHLFGELERIWHFLSRAHVIYLHPKATDGNLFLTEHFSLNPEVLATLMRSGFRSAIEILKQYEFVFSS